MESLSSIKQQLFPQLKVASGMLCCSASALACIKAMSVIDAQYAKQCTCVMQSPVCTAYAIAGIASSAIIAAAAWGVIKGMNSMERMDRPAPIRNPSVIPNGSEPSFFRSQQNGSFARYAEDDLQGTHRRPLGNYDPVRWEGGSQSI